MNKTNDIHLEKLFETKEIIPNSFLTTIEEEMLVLQNKISELEKKNLNLLIQNSASQKFKDEISFGSGLITISSFLRILSTVNAIKEFFIIKTFNFSELVSAILVPRCRIELNDLIKK